MASLRPDHVLRVEEVFTPASPATAQVFAERTHMRLQQRVEEALTTPGSQLIVYGSTGVGKTSLIRNVCRRMDLSRVDVSAGPPFGRLLDDALSKLDPSQYTGSSDRTSVAGDGKASIGVASGSLRSTTEHTHTEIPRPQSQIGELLACMRRTRTRVLFIDNFEAAERERHYPKTVAKLGELIKAFSDAAEEYAEAPVLVVAGIPSALETLVAFEPAVARRTVQLEVPQMNEDELGRIIERGAAQLALAFDDTAKGEMVELSNGYPYYVHLFALHSVRAALRDNLKWPSSLRRIRVTDAHLEQGLHRAVEDDDMSLSTKYVAAVSSISTRQTRKLALEALARTQKLESDLSAIRQAHLDVYPNDAVRFIGGALKELDERHDLVARRTRPGSAQQLYRFRDPLMKGYVRARARLGDTAVP